MLCYNVLDLLEVIIIKELNIKLLKNNNEVLNSNVFYNKNDNIIDFVLDDMNCILIPEDNKITFKKENKDYIFKLILGDINSSEIFLKEQNASFDIKVEDGSFSIIDNKIVLNYQLETDYNTSIIEILL